MLIIGFKSLRKDSIEEVADAAEEGLRAEIGGEDANEVVELHAREDRLRN